MRKRSFTRILIGLATAGGLIVGVTLPASANGLKYDPVEQALGVVTESSTTDDQAVLENLAVPRTTETGVALSTQLKGPWFQFQRIHLIRSP